MKTYPVTYWYSNLGFGDGQDMATRGYLRSLQAVKYEHVMLPQEGFAYLDKPEFVEFQDLMGVPAQYKFVKKRVKAGDPRIGGRWKMFPDVRVGELGPGAPPGAEVPEWDNIIREHDIDNDEYFELVDGEWVEKGFTDPWNPECEMVVAHYDPGKLARVRDVLARHGASEKPLAGLTVWESDKIPVSIAQQLSDLDMLIVGSKHTEEAFLNSGFDEDVPIVVVPHALTIDPITKGEILWSTQDMEGPRADRYDFYAIGTMIERKNFASLIAAFARAFYGRYNEVSLTIKTSGSDLKCAELFQQGMKLSGIKSNEVARSVVFKTDRLSDEQMRAFHFWGQCYVEMTRAEGFGLGIQEALTMGNPVITPEWGAQVEVARMGGVEQFVDYTLVNVTTEMAEIGVYQEDQMWAEPDIDSMAALMQKAADERWGKDLQRSLRMHDRYNNKRVGQELVAAMQRAKEEF